MIFGEGRWRFQRDTRRKKPGHRRGTRADRFEWQVQ